MIHRNRKAPVALPIVVFVATGCDALLGRDVDIRAADGPCRVESVAGGKKVVFLRNGDRIEFDDPHGHRPSIPSAPLFRYDLGCNRITDPDGAVQIQMTGGLAGLPLRLTLTEYLAALYMDGTRLSEGVAIALKADFDLDMSGPEVEALAARLEQYGVMSRVAPSAGEVADQAVGSDAESAAARAAPLEDATDEERAVESGKKKRKRKKKARKKSRKRKRKRKR